LIQSLKDSFVSYEAIQSLVKTGDKRAVPHIKKFLGHRDVRRQRTAAIALHKLGDDSGVAVIIKSLKSWDKDTRCIAEHTLSQLTGQNFTEGKKLSSFSREKEKEIIQK
jgi:HEAT repeat protein